MSANIWTASILIIIQLVGLFTSAQNPAGMLYNSLSHHYIIFNIFNMTFLAIKLQQWHQMEKNVNICKLKFNFSWVWL